MRRRLSASRMPLAAGEAVVLIVFSTVLTTARCSDVRKRKREYCKRAALASVASRHASAEEASRERNYAATCSADRVRVAGAGRRACRSLARSHKLRSAAAVLGERGAARANAAAARAREELSATDAAFVEESALDAVEAAAAAVETLDAFQPRLRLVKAADASAAACVCVCRMRVRGTAIWPSGAELDPVNALACRTAGFLSSRRTRRHRAGNVRFPVLRAA